MHANQFTGVLSGLIHCSQLWLACHCLSLHPPEAEQDVEAIHRIFKTECGLYLVNNTPSPVSELSYWRLIAGVKTNDTVRPPTTVINDDATAITHRDVTMDIQAWRDCLQTLVTKSTELLDDALSIVFEMPGTQALSPEIQAPPPMTQATAPDRWVSNP